MNVWKLLPSENILCDLSVSTKEELIRLMVSHVLGNLYFVGDSTYDVDDVFDAVMDRDAKFLATIDKEIAIPHARLDSLGASAVILARLNHEIEWSPDKWVKAIILILVPENSPEDEVKMLTELGEFFNDSESHTQFFEAANSRDIWALFQSVSLEKARPIRAADIMRDARVKIRVNTPLRIATNYMVDKVLDVVSVLDEEDRVVGELSCDHLFKIGLPYFFNQLKSVSFIKEFDPFETYFNEDVNATVGEVMGQDFCCMFPDATIMEIIHALSVKGYRKIYVIDPETEKRIGVIDRITVLSNVIF